jgi:hypothetical protein
MASCGQVVANVSPLNQIMLASFLQSVCNMLQRRTNMPVTLGEQTKDSQGLVVWPWRIADNVHHRNMAQGEWNDNQLPGLDVYFLVLAQSGITIEGLSLLEMARQAIYAEPLIIINGVEAHLLSQALPIEELTSIFTAGGLQLSPCLCIVGSLPIAAPDSPANSVFQNDKT